jgi:lysyl-tRNA synthetase class II
MRERSSTPRRRPEGRYDAAKVDPLPLRIAGRILFSRSFGGVTFVRLRDRTGELQIYCDQESLGEAFARMEDLDLGDIVEAEGTAMATQKGELSIKATRLRLLTKALSPAPHQDELQGRRAALPHALRRPRREPRGRLRLPRAQRDRERASAPSSTAAASSRSRRRRCTR